MAVNEVESIECACCRIIVAEVINNDPRDLKVKAVEAMILTVCQLCGQTFKNREELDEHFAGDHPLEPEPDEPDEPDFEILEEELKTYSCGECDFKTHERDNLLGHFRGGHKKIFKCQKCQSSFNEASIRDHHVNAVHGNNGAVETGTNVQ